MKQAIEKAQTLLEARQWIQDFREKITVVKFGGSVIDDQQTLLGALHDVQFMQVVGIRPVVVHGGGKQIDRALQTRGLQPKYIDGRRYTDQPTLEVVEQVLVGEINPYIAQCLESIGGRAMPLSFQSSNVLFGQRSPIIGRNGQATDMGLVGTVDSIDRSVIENLCYAGQVPVIPSMCMAAGEQKLNVNADTAAMAVAIGLSAEKLVLLSDVAGVLTDPQNPGSVISTLTPGQAKKMIDDGAIGGGMIPKVEACLQTIMRGVRKVHILDGSIPHGLLLEIFTSQGIGTQIAAESTR